MHVAARSDAEDMHDEQSQEVQPKHVTSDGENTILHPE
jgi:hypothetical protein